MKIVYKNPTTVLWNSRDEPVSATVSPPAEDSTYKELRTYMLIYQTLYVPLVQTIKTCSVNREHCYFHFFALCMHISMLEVGQE